MTKADVFIEFDKVIEIISSIYFRWNYKHMYKKYSSLFYMFDTYKLILNHIPEDDFKILFGCNYNSLGEYLAKPDYSNELIAKYNNFLDNFDIDDDKMIIGFVKYKYITHKYRKLFNYKTNFIVYRITYLYLDMEDHYNNVFANRNLYFNNC